MLSCAGLTMALLMAPSAAALAAAGEAVKEPATGIEFSGSVDGLPLLGTGCRYKYGLVKVYAVGVYAEAPESCSSGGGGGEGGGGEGGGPWAELVDSSGESSGGRAVVIKMARDVEAKTLIDALGEAFKPRLNLPGRSDASLADFREAVLSVSGGACANGDEFVFSIAKGTGAVTVTARKAGSGSVVKSAKGAVGEGGDLAFAILDTYLGAVLAEVAPSLKESIKKNLGV